MKVLFNDLHKQWLDVENAVQPRLEKLFKTSQYINGEDVEIFEINFAKYVGTKHCIGVSNGTDAIKLGMWALEKVYNLRNILVIIPDNTYVATALACFHGLKNLVGVRYVDCDMYHQIHIKKLKEIVKEEREREFYTDIVVVGVHMFGGCFDVKRVKDICEEYDCILVEDSAQAHGTVTELGKAGSIGEFGAFSFYPGKNLGACGDAGGVVTNDDDINDIIRKIRNMGSSVKHKYDHLGYNNRLDTMQAIILNEKLKHLDRWNYCRETVVDDYIDCGLPIGQLTTIFNTYCLFNTYHIFPIIATSQEDSTRRDKIRDYLQNHEIQTGIHYPSTLRNTPIYNKLETYKQFYPSISKTFSNNMISLPMHPYLTKKEIQYICDKYHEAQNRI